ncbi:MAG TPA: ClpX C4-type zinc finger protein, partial [Acidobacteriota bacterium]|nr:ClpX C4-type zinc finger protein [Acidobacteriota bacterium]
MEHCDFCCKPSTDVEKLFAGPNGVHICDECVEVCKLIFLDLEEHPEIKT